MMDPIPDEYQQKVVRRIVEAANKEIKNMFRQYRPDVILFHKFSLNGLDKALGKFDHTLMPFCVAVRSDDYEIHWQQFVELIPEMLADPYMTSYLTNNGILTKKEHIWTPQHAQQDHANIEEFEKAFGVKYEGNTQ